MSTINGSNVGGDDTKITSFPLISYNFLFEIEDKYSLKKLLFSSDFSAIPWQHKMCMTHARLLTFGMKHLKVTPIDFISPHEPEVDA